VSCGAASVCGGSSGRDGVGGWFGGSGGGGDSASSGIVLLPTVARAVAAIGALLLSPPHASVSSLLDRPLSASPYSLASPCVPCSSETAREALKPQPRAPSVSLSLAGRSPLWAMWGDMVGVRVVRRYQYLRKDGCALLRWWRRPRPRTVLCEDNIAFERALGILHFWGGASTA
jgi:hypothetical protein